jgi:hypothetical protein
MIELRGAIKEEESENALLVIERIVKSIGSELQIKSYQVRQLTLISIQFSKEEEARQFRELLAEAGMGLHTWAEHYND